MAEVINPLITAVGRDAAVSADEIGLTLGLTHIAFGTGTYTPSTGQTALQNEVVRLAIPYASKPVPDQLRMAVVWEAPTGSYPITEVGFWADDILFAVYSVGEGGSPIGYKTPGVNFNFFYDFKLETVPAESVTIVVDEGAEATQIAQLAQHLNDDDAHPQYMRVSDAYSQNLMRRARYATTGDVTLSGLAVQGEGDWASPLTAGDLVFVRAQSDGEDNGIYTTAAGSWSRAPGFMETEEIGPLMQIVVEDGATLAGSQWQMTNTGAITLGTTELTFAQVGGIDFAYDLVRSAGLLGAVSALGVADMDAAPLGRLVSYSGAASEAAANHWPSVGHSGATSQWWNVTTFGASNRTTQFATFGFSPHAGRTFWRGKHDTTWTAWREIVFTDSPVFTGTPGAPTAATDDSSATLANTELVTNKLAARTGSAGALMFRNKIINGDFRIWQRATSQTSTGYGSDDRWRNEHVGSSKNHTRQDFPLGDATVPSAPPFYSRTVVTSSAGASNFVRKVQHIEGVRTLAGKSARLTFHARANSPKNMAVELSQYFGTGGSPSATVNGIGSQLIALTSSWQKFSVTIAVPGISGKTIGTDGTDCLTLALWFEAGSDFDARTDTLGQQSGTFDIAAVQIEEGTSETPFETLPMATALALCERYFEVGTCGMDGYGDDGDFIGYFRSWHTPKRVAPTVTVSGPIYVNTSALTADGNRSDVYIKATIAALGAAGFYGELAADAEL